MGHHKRKVEKDSPCERYIVRGMMLDPRRELEPRYTVASNSREALRNVRYRVKREIGYYPEFGAEVTAIPERLLNTSAPDASATVSQPEPSPSFPRAVVERQEQLSLLPVAQHPRH